MSDDELRRARRHLEVSLSLAFPGSPVREPILNHISAIDVEMERRSGWTTLDSPRGGTGG
jgi:hypothetical protein